MQAETPKRRRRGHGEGACYKRKDGRWAAVLELGWQGAKRLRQTFYGRTKREALDRLAEGRARLLTGLPLGTSRQTLDEFLDTWLRDIVKPNARPEHLRRVRGQGPSLSEARVSAVSGWRACRPSTSRHG